MPRDRPCCQGDRLDWLNSTFIATMFCGGTLPARAFLINEWFSSAAVFQNFSCLPAGTSAHGLLTLVGAVTLLVGVAAIPGQYLAQIHSYRPLANHAAVFCCGAHSPAEFSLPATAALLNSAAGRTTAGSWRLDFGLMAISCFSRQFR
ncbi:hypothetical protein ACFFYR_02040 [Paraburkholderia dipogonis]|uniref:hypothetical protein n=1 Tax=Paraburkholderia dipogonis TaxID=1211383 RepID=UPI0035E82B87